MSYIKTKYDAIHIIELIRFAMNKSVALSSFYMFVCHLCRNNKQNYLSYTDYANMYNGNSMGYYTSIVHNICPTMLSEEEYNMLIKYRVLWYYVEAGILKTRRAYTDKNALL